MRPRDAKVSLQAYSLASAVDGVPSGQHGKQQQEQFDSHGLPAGGGLTLLTSQRFPVDDTLDTHLVLKVSLSVMLKGGRLKAYWRIGSVL